MNSQGDSSYQVVYNVGLLDDIHNYFPALLYEMDRFTNLPQVLQYVRERMTARFNLFNYGASLAAASQTSFGGAHAPPYNTTPLRTSTPIIPRTPAPSVQAPAMDIFSLASLLTHADILTLGIGAGTGPGVGLGAALQPVIVRPSAEVIARATEVLVASTLPEGTVCSICQDSLLGTDSARRIRSCNHVYHQICIDQWFEGSVRCPSCRHDIREN
jgi:hypothetical protein